MKILELLKYPEGKTLEFKRDSNILRTITAFANNELTFSRKIN